MNSEGERSSIPGETLAGNATHAHTRRTREPEEVEERVDRRRGNTMTPGVLDAGNEEYVPERRPRNVELCPQQQKDVLEKLCTRWVGREEQLRDMVGLIGTGYEPAPSLLVCGGVSTGKTSIVKDLMQTLRAKHAYVNCLESATPRQVFLAVLSQLKGSKRRKSTGYMADMKCDRLADFLPALSATIEASTRETVFIVLDEAEKLRKPKGCNMPDTEFILPAFLRLPELCRRKISVILISKLGWSSFHSSHMAEVEPSLIFFPSYSQDEITQILCQSPAVEDTKLYKSFLGQVLPSLTRMCGDLRDIGFLTGVLFQKYVEPIKEGMCTPSERRILWQFFAGTFRAATQAYQAGDDIWNAIQRASEESQERSTSTKGHASLELELPFDSKILLLASFIASRNPASLDARMFENKRATKRRRSALESDRQVAAAQEARLKSPGPFLFERLVTIFNCLLDVVDERHFVARSDRSLSASLFQQLNTLVGLRLLSRVSPDPLESVRYRCNLDERMAEKISRNVQIPLHSFLRYA